MTAAAGPLFMLQQIISNLRFVLLYCKRFALSFSNLEFISIYLIDFRFEGSRPERTECGFNPSNTLFSQNSVVRRAEGDISIVPVVCMYLSLNLMWSNFILF